MLNACYNEHFLRHLGKKKPKIEVLLFLKYLLLFPYYEAGTDNISLLLIAVQIVFATTYYTQNFISCQEQVLLLILIEKQCVCMRECGKLADWLSGKSPSLCKITLSLFQSLAAFGVQSQRKQQKYIAATLANSSSSLVHDEGLSYQTFFQFPTFFVTT